MADAPRKRLGNYDILEKIGEGGEGRIYKAVCIADGVRGVSNGEEVAIKQLVRKGHEKEPILFQRQVEILRKLDHPNIVRYKDVFVWENDEIGDEFYCLVTELLSGENLKEWIDRNPNGIPCTDVRAIFSQILGALRYANRTIGLIHRDLKPSNIIITYDGIAKLVDFGIARHRDAELSHTASSAGPRGTFDYMAPEFAKTPGFHGDEQSDIFSFGVCLHHALTGNLPFPALGDEPAFAYMRRWLAEKPPDPYFRTKKRVFDVVRGARTCIRKCIDLNRDARLKTFEEVQSVFDRIRPAKLESRGEVCDYIEFLGEGGFGRVYRARRRSDGLEVAIKELSQNRFSKRFLLEAKILEKAAHPNLVRYVDFVQKQGEFEDDLRYYLVLEYLEGMPDASLRNRIKQSGNGLNPVELLQLFCGYLNCLEYLHQDGKIHRDIKPANLYAPAGKPREAKVFDLGIALDQDATATLGHPPGTPDYMPPEFALINYRERGRRMDDEGVRGSPQSDIYSLGVSLYEALTGKLPLPKLPVNQSEAWTIYFQRAATGENAYEASYSFEHPVFREHNELKSVLRRALAYKPERRYTSSREMREVLLKTLHDWSDKERRKEEERQREELARIQQKQREQEQKQREEQNRREKERREEEQRQKEELARKERELQAQEQRQWENLEHALRERGYERQALIGRGGFADVYRGCRRDGWPVAIKCLTKATYAERFIREARLLKTVEHPHLVRYLDFFDLGDGDQKQYFLVLELLDGMPGSSLKDHLREINKGRPKHKKEGLPEEEVLELFVCYLDCLEYLHTFYIEEDKGIIHRDIKPQNLYAQRGKPEKAKVFDLGIAKDEGGTPTPSSIGVPGTPPYMPPEFAERDPERRGSPQSDIFSLAASMYEALTGDLPWERGSDDHAAWAYFWKRAQQPIACHFDHTVFERRPELIPVLQKALAFEPTARYESAKAMAFDLERILEKWKAPPPPKPLPPPPPPPPDPEQLRRQAVQAVQEHLRRVISGRDQAKEAARRAEKAANKARIIAGETKGLADVAERSKRPGEAHQAAHTAAGKHEEANAEAGKAKEAARQAGGFAKDVRQNAEKAAAAVARLASILEATDENIDLTDSHAPAPTQSAPAVSETHATVPPSVQDTKATVPASEALSGTHADAPHTAATQPAEAIVGNILEAVRGKELSEGAVEEADAACLIARQAVDAAAKSAVEAGEHARRAALAWRKARWKQVARVCRNTAFVVAGLLIIGGIAFGVVQWLNQREAHQLQVAEEEAQRIASSTVEQFPIGQWLKLRAEAERKILQGGKFAPGWGMVTTTLASAIQQLSSTVSNQFNSAVVQKDDQAAETVWNNARTLHERGHVSLDPKWVLESEAAIHRLRLREIELTSDPSGAEVFLQEVSLGSTPIRTNLMVGTTNEFVARHPSLPDQRQVFAVEQTRAAQSLAFRFPHGRIQLNSNPTGATVFMNDKEIGKTPFPAPLIVNTGQFTCVLRQGNYVGKEVFNVIPGAEIVKTVALTPLTGQIVVNSKPEGATIYTNNALVGRTPLKREWAIGPYQLEGQYSGLDTQRMQIVVKEDESRSVDFLFPHGSLHLTSKPSGVDVFTNGVLVGRTPYQVDIMRPCTVEYDLISPTHKGKVKTAILHGHSIKTNVVLAHRQGAMQITSDPSGAEVWSGKQSLGATPVNLQTNVGSYQLTLKTKGLEDRAVAVNVIADRQTATNVVFAYGGLVVESEPSGATVSRDGRVVGRTPYTNSMLKPGQSAWQLALDDHIETNVVVQVTDHHTVSSRVTLQRGMGTLKFSCNIPDAEIRWAEKDTKLTSGTVLPVPAGIKHTFEASYCGAYKKLTDISVAMGKTKTVELVLDKAESWTNNIGMVFHLLPALRKRFWVGETRVTPQQYAAVMGPSSGAKSDTDVGRECVTYISCSNAREFAGKLESKGLPSGFRADVPTTDEWVEVAKVVEQYGEEIGMVGIRDPASGVTKYPEWCVTDRSSPTSNTSAWGQFTKPFGASASQARAGSMKAPDEKTEATIRIVLVPR